MVASSLLGIILVVLISVLLGTRGALTRPTLRQFFFADYKLTQGNCAHLLWATSLSLNGLFYHTWLGYSIGVYSLLIQAIWCSSFLLLGLYSDRLRQLARDGSLPEIISRYFGSRAGFITSLAALLSLAILAGWELSIAGSFAQEALGAPENAAIPLVLVLAFMTAAYTVRGGLEGNLRANVFQNHLKFVALLIVIVVLFMIFARAETGLQKPNHLKLDLPAALVAVGGFLAFFSNAVFSICWQFADTSTWQNVTASLEDSASPRRGLGLAALGIFISPGLFGTMLGMSFASVPGLSDTTILPQMFRAIADNPYLPAILCAAFTAAMLSTLDGQFLAAAMIVVTNFGRGGDFRELVENPGRDPRREDSLLRRAYAAIFATALISTSVYLLVHFGIIGLFQTVYLAVVGQVAVAPLCFLLIRGREREAWPHAGSASIATGLITGISFVTLGIIGMPKPGWLDWIGAAPLATVTAGAIVAVIGLRRNSN